ncbi:hypothetical protein HID58_024151 [Brassica napus]|uniref:BnaA06g40160D protein n=2 Tax=Brassica napus TaxID=3708 RepID=A0A078JG96_BRANA|nr:hypothetical protein HID58_024151 [Brassica napus]CAF2090999.1 unnamed protein product [Brassica napus]CDY64686.1 BnaA06g40160D [Brassica napus]
MSLFQKKKSFGMFMDFIGHELFLLFQVQIDTKANYIGGFFSISWLAFVSGVSLASSVNQSATVSGDTPDLSVMSAGLSPFYFEARIRWFSFIFATVVILLFWGIASLDGGGLPANFFSNGEGKY